MPIGGLKEKIYAAVRAGIKKVLIPDENYRELREFDKNIINSIKIIPVSEAITILKHTLVKPVIPLNMSESELISLQKKQIQSTSVRENLPN